MSCFADWSKCSHVNFGTVNRVSFYVVDIIYIFYVVSVYVICLIVSIFIRYSLNLLISATLQEKLLLHSN